MTVHFVHLLDELRRRSLRMASLVEDMVHEACDAVLQADHALAQRIIARDADVDSEEVLVEAEVIRLLALYQPVGSDLRLLCTVLKINDDLERIADGAVNMAERARHLDTESVAPERTQLRRLCTIVQQSLRSAIHAYSNEDPQEANSVVAQDDAVDALYGQIVREVIAEAAGSPGQLAARLDILSAAKNLERIADQATNIAEHVIFLSTGQIVRHQKRGGGKKT